jgi:hypothetical protein
MPHDDSDSLVSGYEGHGWLHRPIPVGGVDVGVAQTAGFHTHQNLAWPRLRDRAILDGQRTIERPDDCCSHACSNPDVRARRFRIQ